MTKRYLITGIIIAGFGLAAAGCGGNAPNEPTLKMNPDDPFASDNTDLKASSKSYDSTGAYNTDDVKVPGAKYGKKPEKAGKKAKRGKKGKRGKKNKGISNTIPASVAISEEMEGLPWGMTVQSVTAYYEKRIREGYSEEFKGAGGAVEEDQVRSNMLRDIAKLKKSFVEFKGQRTGFEGSLVENEFVHNNGESMIMYDAGKYVEYLFFFDGRFWKRLRAFRKDRLNNLAFDEYKGSLYKRFEPGLEVINDKQEMDLIRWKDDDSYMNAEDRSGFYGVYCLVFMARVTADNLDKLRTQKGRHDGSVESDVSNMVESVTGGHLTDDDHSVIDSYTGHSGSGSSEGPDLSNSVMGDRLKKDDKKKDKKEEKKEEKKDDDDDFDLF